MVFSSSNSTFKGSNERRDFERLTINTAVSLTFGNPPQASEAICRDLSGNGIGLEVGSMVPLGAECQVTIHDGHRNQQRFQALIEVKRILPLANDRFLVGAVILEKY